MGIFDWLKPRPPARLMNDIARDLANAVFALHPSASDRVVLQLGQVAQRRVVVMMEVPSTDPARSADPVPDRAQQTARISELVAELGTRVPTAGNELTVMRDRVVWMPVVLPINPALPFPADDASANRSS
jgi:hypothetical protein